MQLTKKDKQTQPGINIYCIFHSSQVWRR